MHLFLLLSFCLITCYGKYQDDDWIDPTDMLNYDAAAGRMKHQKPYHTEKTALNEDSNEQAEGTCQLDNLDCKTDPNIWKEKDSKEGFSEKNVNEMKGESVCQKSMEDMDTLKKEIEEWRTKGGIPASSCNPVFRRFLYRIINEAQLLGLPDESQPEVHYDAELVFTKQMVAEFQRFLDDTDWNAGPLDEALGKTLVRLRQHNEEEWSWDFEDYIGTDPFTAFMISLSLLCIVLVVATELWTHVSWFTQISRLFCLSFLISIVWNWMYLYKDAFAERQAKLAKIGNTDACVKQMSWSDSLLEWWKSSSSFQNDPCEEYFKALMVNPILLVPPTKAFAVTFTNFITEPLKHMGKGIGEFFHALLAEMPLFYQPIVLIIIALSLVVFLYGLATTVHRINWLRRNPDRERERLPPPNPQRDGNDQFIEGRDGRIYNNPQPIQPRHVEGHSGLQPVDCEDINNSQQEVKSFIESVSTSQPTQRKPVALEKRTHGQHIRDEASGQLQSKDGCLDHRHLSQQPVKKLEDSPLGSQDRWKESLKDREPVDKISPIHQDCSGSHSEVKGNRLPDVETLVSMSQFTEEVKVRKASTEGEKDQLLTKENRAKDHLGNNSPVTVIASTEHAGAQGTTFYPIESNLSNLVSDVEDIYTDSGYEQQPKSLSFVTIEEQEMSQEEMLLLKQTIASEEQNSVWHQKDY